MSVHRQKLSEKILLYTVLIIGALVSIFPFYWMFVSATRPSADVFAFPPKLFFGGNLLENIKSLNNEINLWRVFFNSIAIASIYTVITAFLSALAGYALAKFEFKGKTIIFTAIMLTMMLPAQAKMVPLFEIMAGLNWTNTYQAVILPDIASAFGIFLMRQNMLKVPDAIIESARIDGCSEFKIFLKIIFPTMRPALAALAIYMFIFQWGNFMWQLIVLNANNMKTLPVALATLQQNNTHIDYGQILIGTTLTVIPVMILFVLLQKQFVAGIFGGSVKG